MMLVTDINKQDFAALLQRFELNLIWVASSSAIPGSYWGEPEAGLVNDQLIVRADTPLHSALHEACHYICMDDDRRTSLHTNSGGDCDEENAVCYLQILLASYIADFSQQHMFEDMDAWGYSFRLGSASQWFEHDAEDAKDWLLKKNLINNALKPTWSLRQ